MRADQSSYSLELSQIYFTFTANDDSHDDSIDSEHLSHHNRNHGFYDEFGLNTSQRDDCRGSLVGAVGGSQAGEDEGGNYAHVSYEVLIVFVS
jgi:hypothetical protein